MTLFLLLYFVSFLIIAKKRNFEVCSNTNYWLIAFWSLIIGIFLTSGINYKYGHSFEVWLFILICAFSYYLGLKKSNNISARIFSSSYTKISLTKYCILGLIGVSLFTYDYIRLNGIVTAKGGTDISMLGSIGSLFVPILLVIGIYMNALSLKQKGKFNFWGIILIIAYTVPCMINAGRESMLFGIIGILCLYGYNVKVRKANFLKESNNAIKKFFIFFFLGISVFFLGYLMLEISSTRFTDNEINVLLSQRDISMSAINEASTWGSFDFMYYNVASYFSHQIPFLDFTLREYNGPYILGCYELNIVSRRLPDFLNLDYRSVFSQLQRLYLINGESFIGSWNTVLGSLIVDFSWVGTIIVCYWCGYAVGLAKKKLQLTLDPRYATLVALFCLSTFSTIQLGPFFQTQIYGTYIWWYIFFRRDETQKVML